MRKEVIAHEDGQQDEIVNNPLQTVLERKDRFNVVEFEVEIFSHKRQV
jgi:hypothetical protein